MIWKHSIDALFEAANGGGEGGGGDEEPVVEKPDVTENSEGFIALTNSGREAAEQLESSLPFTAREKVVREAHECKEKSAGGDCKE